jgi:ParB/RepB/Spo0J family partition protein
MDAKNIRDKWGGKSTAKPVGRVGPDALNALEKIIEKNKPVSPPKPPKIDVSDLEITGQTPPSPSTEPGPSQSPNGIGTIKASDSTGGLVTDASKPNSLDGDITMQDIVGGKFNPYMMYQVPLGWIDFEDSANYNRDPIELMEKSEGFTALVDSIKDVGQKYPGVARVNPATGRLQITDGWRRALACRKGKIGLFLCVLSNASDVDAAVEALALNLLREDLPEYKKLDEIRKLHDQHGLTYDEITRKVGFGTKGVISESLLIYEFPEIEKPFRTKKLTLNQARTLARVAKKQKLEPRQISALARQIGAKEIQLKELPFLASGDHKKISQSGKAEVYFFAETKDGGLFYRCKLDPKKPNVGEWRKAIDKAELLITALKKAIKDR